MSDFPVVAYANGVEVELDADKFAANHLNFDVSNISELHRHLAELPGYRAHYSTLLSFAKRQAERTKLLVKMQEAMVYSREKRMDDSIGKIASDTAVLYKIELDEAVRKSRKLNREAEWAVSILYGFVQALDVAATSWAELARFERAQLTNP